MPSVIEVKNLEKKYKINQSLGKHKTLRDSLAREAKNLLRFAPGAEYSGKQDFWALKNINFAVRKGEVLGIIGPNGAGKSTLLKILSRITPPSGGEIRIQGRVASLLEVGTGFHPELSGRENIYLNGAILGMAKQEIQEKFERIVEFSGVSKFLDTPVKRYSSGMSVRLAFAVAAHLEPEVLLVDEVLAVGDAEFQKRCLGKMNEVTQKAGRTILFVSHNMDAIRNLCERTILLKDGQIEMIDRSDKVIHHYLSRFNNEGNTPLHKRRDRKGKGDIWFTDIGVRNHNNEAAIRSGDKLRIELRYESNHNSTIENARVSITLNNIYNIPIVRLSTAITKNNVRRLKPKGLIVCETDNVNLAPGMYFMNIAMFKDKKKQDHVVNALSLKLESNQDSFNFFGNGENNNLVLVPHSFYIKD